MRRGKLTAVAVAGLALAVPASASADPPGSYCADGWKVTKIRNLGMKFKRAQPVQRNENRTNKPITTTFEVSKTKTFTWHLNVKVSAEAKFAIFASVKAEVDGGVERSVTTNLRNNVTYRIPARRAGIGKYGFYYRRVSGVAELGSGGYCRKAIRFRGSVPRGEGWRLSIGRL